MAPDVTAEGRMSSAGADVIVRLSAEVARAVHAGAQDTPGTKELNAALRRFGVVLEPQYPGAADAELQCYFTVSKVSLDQAEPIAATLREFEAVEAAYVQPPVSPA